MELMEHEIQEATGTCLECIQDEDPSRRVCSQCEGRLVSSRGEVSWPVYAEIREDLLMWESHRLPCQGAMDMNKILGRLHASMAYVGVFADQSADPGTEDLFCLVSSEEGVLNPRLGGGRLLYFRQLLDAGAYLKVLGRIGGTKEASLLRIEQHLSH